MAKADLTAQRVREVLDYDPETGVFVWKKPTSNRVFAGMVAGSKNPLWGRLQIRVDGYIYFAHRLAWLYVYGAWPREQIDHIDCNPLNNRIANLRDVPSTTNMQNRPVASHGRSKLIGAQWHGQANKWRARIMANGSVLNIGLFDTPEEAHAAYLKEKRRLHQGCTI